MRNNPEKQLPTNLASSRIWTASLGVFLVALLVGLRTCDHSGAQKADILQVNEEHPLASGETYPRGDRNGRREQRERERELAAAVADLVSKIKSMELSRVAVHATGRHKVSVNPELRRIYQVPNHLLTIETTVKSIVVRAPNTSEKNNIKQMIAETFLPFSQDMKVEVSNKYDEIAERFLNYSKKFKIVSCSVYTDQINLAHKSIVAYDTDDVVEWNSDSGLELAPSDDMALPESIAGGHTAVKDRYSYLFDLK